MPTTKPLKSVNLDADDHELAQKIADFLTRKQQENSQRGLRLLPPEKISLKGGIHAALVNTATKLGIIEGDPVELDKILSGRQR